MSHHNSTPIEILMAPELKPVLLEGTEFKDANRKARRHVVTTTGKTINIVNPSSYMRMLPGRF